MSVQRIDVYVTPVFLELDGAKVTIVGIVPYETLSGDKRYLVSCYVEWRGWRSQTFQLDVATNEELTRKLRVEIARMKVFVLSGNTQLFQRVG